MGQIEEARKDYLEGRYAATVLALLPVMDGFVNDVETERRCGLHARTAVEMSAWDSVVGHHLGLSHAHRSFTRPFGKTVTDEVFELYRHGIVHGRVINFNNDVVATKAWNRLYAVADWAASREKQRQPPEPQPGLREVLQSMDQNRQTNEARAAWRPSELAVGEPGFEEDELVQRARDYLRSWQAKNYGRMAALVSPLVAESSAGHMAGRVRQTCSAYQLSSFVVQRVHHLAAAVTELDVELIVGGEPKVGRMRWTRADATGSIVMPNQAGSWGLVTWGPEAIVTVVARGKAS